MEQKRKPLKVLMDANAFFVPFQFQIDVFEELKRLLNRRFEPVILRDTYEEIKRLAEEGAPKIRRQALAALKLAEKCRILSIEPSFQSASHDDLIVEAARRWKCPVFTNDRVLRNRLRDINVPVIYLRQKSRLEIEGRI
ncbi:nucleotide-binding protein [Candidatus Bathyarchaeota archaeon]|nr:MAG: nucleotide-binding protein [Candidatus Bathyarchaeota archaeon]RLI30130.1 MAG: nucleotide-binding protein [Candidatus Bathyarchaeota archaeon]